MEFVMSKWIKVAQNGVKNQLNCKKTCFLMSKIDKMTMWLQVGVSDFGVRRWNRSDISCLRKGARVPSKQLHSRWWRSFRHLAGNGNGKSALRCRLCLSEFLYRCFHFVFPLVCVSVSLSISFFLTWRNKFSTCSFFVLYSGLLCFSFFFALLW